jgi:peroxiredoxin
MAKNRRRKRTGLQEPKTRPATDPHSRPKKHQRKVPARFPREKFAYGVVGLALLAGVFLLVRGAFTGGGSVPTVEARTAVRGQPAPDSTASTFDGGMLTLSSLRGKPVMINFFASWCDQCKRELPGIEAVYERHKAEGFTVVGVNALENGDGKAMYRSLGLTFPGVYDPGQPGPIANVYGVTVALPGSIFIDKQGRIDMIVRGAVSEGTVEQEVVKLLQAS